MQSNVLITSAGRRGVLVGLFQKAISMLSPGGCVYAGDLHPKLSSACQLADGAVATPPILDPGYIDFLLEFCEDRSINVVVPTIDTDLRLLAENRQRFLSAGTNVVISDVELVAQCRDKRLTPALFSQYGISSPTPVDPLNEPMFPLIAKPIDGSSSNNLHIIAERNELRPEIITDPSLLFFKYLTPDEHDEYTVDMYFDRGGVLKCLIPRLRIATRAGEVSKSKTVRIASIDFLREKFRYVKGARGCLTGQFFERHHDGKLFGIEVNARFGGGYPLSCESGANFPEWIVREYCLEEQVDYFDEWEDQLTMLRYDEHVLVRGPSAA